MDISEKNLEDTIESVLHNTEDRRVFDSVVVITDRRVLDKQLQQRENLPGLAVRAIPR